VIYNDAAYGAEIHQYGSQGLTEKPMLIPEVDFSGIARALGAESADSSAGARGTCRTFRALKDWIDGRRQGHLRGRLPDHLQRPGPLDERVDERQAGGADRVTADDRKTEIREKSDCCFDVANSDTHILKFDGHALKATKAERLAPVAPLPVR
jgi:hypothetical protein